MKKLLLTLATLACVGGARAATATVKIPIFTRLPIVTSTAIATGSDSSTLTAVISDTAYARGTVVVPAGSRLQTVIDADHAPASPAQREATIITPNGTQLSVNGYFIQSNGKLGLPPSPKPSFAIVKGERAVFVILGEG